MVCEVKLISTFTEKMFLLNISHPDKSFNPKKGQKVSKP